MKAVRRHSCQERGTGVKESIRVPSAAVVPTRNRRGTVTAISGAVMLLLLSTSAVYETEPQGLVSLQIFDCSPSGFGDRNSATLRPTVVVQQRDQMRQGFLRTKRLKRTDHGNANADTRTSVVKSVEQRTAGTPIADFPERPGDFVVNVRIF